MPRAAAAKAPAKPKDTEPADPLADLREEGDRYGTPGAQGGPQDGPPAPGEGDPLATLLGEAVGAASVCWEPKPEGVFQPEQASAIVDDLLASLRPMLDVQATDADAAVERWHADTVAVGFLHKGGRCGCAYLARVILGA